jgi:hypothetical protein
MEETNLYTAQVQLVEAMELRTLALFPSRPHKNSY